MKVIKSSSPYTFGKRQFIYLYNAHKLNIDSILAVAKTARPPLYRLLHRIVLNDGIISQYDALKLVASPLESSSTKVSTLDDMLKLLKRLDMVYQKRDFNNVVYILLKAFDEELEEAEAAAMMAAQYSRMVLDASVLPDILRWLGKSNLIDNDNPIYRNKKTPGIGAKHNNLVWDAMAYTRATGINPVLGAAADTVDKQTLVVLDVVLCEEYNEDLLNGFYERIQINRKSVNEGARKVMPIIVYRSCSALALHRIHKLGFVAFDIGYIFGTRIYDILARTQELSAFFQENSAVDESVEDILKMIAEAGQTDMLKDLRGTLFEFLMYPLLRGLYPDAYFDRGRTLTGLDDTGKKIGYEYDYIIRSANPPELVFVELKGYNSAATIALGHKNKKATLKWFFDRTLQFGMKYFKQEISEGLRPKAVYITSANFWDDGKSYLAAMNQGKLKSINMDIGYDGASLTELLIARGFKNEVKIIKKFYTKPEAS
jgi:hypothetical protein